jgi:hypothetical protein
LADRLEEVHMHRFKAHRSETYQEANEAIRRYAIETANFALFERSRFQLTQVVKSVQQLVGGMQIESLDDIGNQVPQLDDEHESQDSDQEPELHGHHTHQKKMEPQSQGHTLHQTMEPEYWPETFEGFPAQFNPEHPGQPGPFNQDYEHDETSGDETDDSVQGDSDGEEK